MDEKKPASPWDELVDELGVEADAAALQRRQPKSELPSRSAGPDKPRQPPKPKPGDWNALAGALGVEVPPPEKSQSRQKNDIDELPELRSEFDKALVESMDDGDVEDESRPETGMSGEAARTAFDALFAETASEWALPTSSGNVLDTPLEFTEEGSVAGEFDSDIAEEEPQSERPKRRRGRRRRRGRGSRGGEGEKARSDEAPAEEGEEETSLDEPEDESSPRETDSEERPRRRRPRRRRGRGDKSERAPVGAKPAVKDKVDDDDDDDDDDSAADHQGGLFDLGDDEDDDEIDAEGQDDGGGRLKANHRNLPTWSEAIGVIVDANMLQRSKSPSRPSGPPRGRGRGGRGRKRS